MGTIVGISSYRAFKGIVHVGLMAVLLAGCVSKPPSQHRGGQTFRDCAVCPEMIVVEPGTFQMGDLAGDGDWDETPVHEVTIQKPFAVGVYEVTQREWREIMRKYPPIELGEDYPVLGVSWRDANFFIEKISGLTGKEYRFLSEAEWEYVARAGTTSKYFWGDEIGIGNASCSGCGSRWDDRRPAPVGSFRPNAFGVYDMHGNVWEWVYECRNGDYDDNFPPNISNLGPCGRILRGGSWESIPDYLRSSERQRRYQASSIGRPGFRVARTIEPSRAKELVLVTPFQH